MMNFIDIASWQEGISLAGLFALNDKLDGVIVKATQGTGYVNPCAKGWLDWLVQNGKPAGTYHYLDKMGAQAEARYYVESVKPWLGKVTLAIDYEEGTLSMGTGYLKACLDEVYKLTGVKPMVYCSQSVTQQQDFSAIAADGYPLWVAQYADMAPVDGFVEHPWQQGSVAPFNGFIMQQYASTGRLAGWSGNLDFDLFNGSYAMWTEMARGEEAKPAPQPDPAPEPIPVLKGPDPVVISDILHGKYGVGGAREKKLREAGYDPKKCQEKVNQLYSIAMKIRPMVAGNLDYLNSIDFIVRLP